MLTANYFAALLDHIGLSELLSAVRGPYQDTAHFMRSVGFMREAGERVLSLRAASSRRCQEVVAAGYELSKRHPGYGKLDLRSYSFADTTVLYYSLAEVERGKVPVMHGMPVALVAVSLLMLQGLAAGVPLRGAIEVEMGCVLPGGELFGRVMASCHDMEDRLASSIRVIVGPVLLAMIEAGKSLSAAYPDFLLERELATRAASYITRDPTDGLYVLDYLEGAKTIWQDQPGFDLIVDKALSFLRREEDRWTRQKKSHIAAKYRAAIKYFAYKGYGIHPPPPSPEPASQPHG